MKRFIKLLILIISIVIFTNCSNSKNYYVLYRIYYPTEVHTFYYSSVLKGDYTLQLTSSVGTNILYLRAYKSLRGDICIARTTAPIEVVEYFNTFVKTYGINK